jgi:hypothetical protein
MTLALFIPLGVAVLALFACFIVIALVLAEYLAGHAPIRDEDEELLHPLGRTRLP